jgi:hypothetical protein
MDYYDRNQFSNYNNTYPIEWYEYYSMSEENNRFSPHGMSLARNFLFENAFMLYMQTTQESIKMIAKIQRETVQEHRERLDKITNR